VCGALVLLLLEIVLRSWKQINLFYQQVYVNKILNDSEGRRSPRRIRLPRCAARWSCCAGAWPARQEERLRRAEAEAFDQFLISF
jgi:hypothetical protein